MSKKNKKAYQCPAEDPIQNIYGRTESCNIWQPCHASTEEYNRFTQSNNGSYMLKYVIKFTKQHI